MKKTEDISTVYILQCADLVKIGCTRELTGRLRTLKSEVFREPMRLLAVMEGRDNAWNAESALLARFKRFKVNSYGWFAADPELLRLIADLPGARA